MEIAKLLGVDPAEPGLRHALHLVGAERTLLTELVMARTDAGLSQAAVGERMGISQAAVAKIESGNRDPRLSTLRRYANAVGASVRFVVQPQRDVEAGYAAAATDHALRLVQQVEDPDETWDDDLFLPTGAVATQ